LTASLEKRAERRHKQLIGKEVYLSLDGVLQGIAQRDARDSERQVAPLKQGADACLLDTTALNIAEAIGSVLALYQTVRKQSGS
jgi:cytidylate kinase